MKNINKGSAVVVAVIVIIVLAIIGGGVWYYVSNKPEPKACTLEAKLCPGGTYVSRTGPNCEFADCPVAEDQFKDWKTYKNEEYGFEVKYPGDWNFSDDTENYSYIVFCPYSRCFGMGYNLAVTLSINDLSAAAVMDPNYCDIDNSVCRFWYPDGSLNPLIVQKNVTVNDIEIKLFEADSLNKGTINAFWKGEIRKSQKGKSVAYDLYELSAPGLEYHSSLREIFNQILSTFKFTK